MLTLFIGFALGAAAGYYVGYKRPGVVLLQLGALVGKIMAKIKGK